MKHLLLMVSTLFILNSSFSIAFAAGPVLPQTGQTGCWDTNGAAIDCTNTGQAGEQQTGASWPSPRFTDNANGTVTDNLTGRIWLKNADCFSGHTWVEALAKSNTLATGSCGLTDGSTAGQWRLPNVLELRSLVNEQQASPATWLNTQGFSNVKLDYYWSSSTLANSTGFAWYVYMGGGNVDYGNKLDFSYHYVWPVRGGQ